MTITQTTLLARRPVKRKIPDRSILVMSMQSFFERYLVGEFRLQPEFLEYRQTDIKVREMSVEQFVHNVSHQELLKSGLRFGKHSIRITQIKLGHFNISWEKQF